MFPLTDPAGTPTSAIGRAITDTTRPKYDTLPAAKGYQKTIFNGGAVALARQAGAPLILVEGPLDAAACVAAGLPLAAAICGASYRHPEHFAGLSTVILALDTDPAGQAGRQALWLALIAHGIEVLLLPAAALDGCKDLAEYWQRHGRMPEQLAARMMGPHQVLPTSSPCRADARRPLDRDPHASRDTPCTAGAGHGAIEIEPAPYAALAQRAAAPDLDLDALDPALRAEAEQLAVELAANAPELIAFVTDLQRRAGQLTPEDGAAGWYAVQLAVIAINTATAA